MASKGQKKGKENKSLLSEILFKYMPYWPLFIVVGLASIFGAWFYLKKTAPEYEISASIMLKDEKKGTSDGEVIKSLDQLTGTNIVENELEVSSHVALKTPNPTFNRLGITRICDLMPFRQRSAHEAVKSQHRILFLARHRLEFQP